MNDRNERNLRLWSAWKGGDDSARLELIRVNRSLAVTKARRFARATGIEASDAYQSAILGVALAVRNWEPARGRLASAMYCAIGWELTALRRDRGRMAPIDDPGSLVARRDGDESRRSAAETVAPMLARLNRNERWAVAAYLAAGCDADATEREAGRAGYSAGWTRDTLRRAMSRLRGMIEASEAA